LGIFLLILWVLHRHRQRQKEKRRRELGIFEQKRFSAHRPFILSAGGSLDSPTRLGLAVPAPLAPSSPPPSPSHTASFVGSLGSNMIANAEDRRPADRSSMPSPPRWSSSKLASPHPNSTNDQTASLPFESPLGSPGESSLVPSGSTQPAPTLTPAVANTSTSVFEHGHRPALSEPAPMATPFIGKFDSNFFVEEEC